jgi:hypothetical protein
VSHFPRTIFVQKTVRCSPDPNLEQLFWDDVVTSILSTRKQASTIKFSTMKRKDWKEEKKSQVKIPMKTRIQDQERKECQLEKIRQKLLHQINTVEEYSTDDYSTDEST